jgi:AraC-like DNA-binding protein
MSKYHLPHRFRQVLGVTFRNYLLTVRPERASALLPARHASINRGRPYRRLRRPSSVRQSIQALFRVDPFSLPLLGLSAEE